MRPFSYSRADTVQSAVHARMASDTPPNAATVYAPSQYLAGGTTLIDLMKLDVMRPQNVTDINALESTPAGEIEFGAHGLHLGALVRMSTAADHPDVRRNYPMIAQSLELAASPQIRNMASLGGNVLQRSVVPISATPPTRLATNARRVPAALPWTALIGCRAWRRTLNRGRVYCRPNRMCRESMNSASVAAHCRRAMPCCGSAGWLQVRALALLPGNWIAHRSFPLRRTSVPKPQGGGPGAQTRFRLMACARER